jgi:8-oxo-dGTP pyrophosphatase MutT (NUDIX family)
VSGIDSYRLSRTLTWLLRHGANGVGLDERSDGCFQIEEVARALSRAIRRPVSSQDVFEAVRCHGGNRFALQSGRIQVSHHDGQSLCGGPDLLYHPASVGMVEEYVGNGAVRGRSGAPLPLMRGESEAWHHGHRLWADPEVLFIDASRARRDGVQLLAMRNGQFTADEVPLRYVLNLREGFAEQASAGGFVVDWSGARPRIALIRVVRRHGATWEVAKGKIEPGETPGRTAVREVKEEMGVTAQVLISRSLGTVRYGFSTPDGSPRLKTIHLYLLELSEAVVEFQPAGAEGIETVAWFSVEDALDVLAHPSLRMSIGRLLDALADRALELGFEVPDEALRYRETG